MAWPSILLVGHRGAKWYEPENTLRSFKAAIVMGANAVELDVRLSRDGVPVVIHDKTLERTTNGKGFVSDFTLKQLRQLDAGKGESIPTLEEALGFLKGKAKVLVEVKEPESVGALVRVISSMRLEGEVLIHSYYPGALAEVARLDPDIQTGLIFESRIKNFRTFLDPAGLINAKWLLPRADVFSKKLLDEAHKRGFKVLVWVCNTIQEIKKFLKLGVDGVASDKPDLFKEIKAVKTIKNKSKQFINKF